MFTPRHSRAFSLTITVLCILQLEGSLFAQGQSGQNAAGIGELISIDFASAPLGAPPKEVRVVSGKLDIVEKDGVHMLRSAEDSTFLVSIPEKIPNRFAIDFDIVPKFSGSTNTTELSFEGTREVSHSEQSAHVMWSHNKVSVIGGGQTYAGGQIDLPEDLREEVIGNLTQVRAEFDGSNLTVTTNGRTVFESKIAKFNRGRILRVQLGGTDADENAVYLASIRMTSLDASSKGSAEAVQQNSGAGKSANQSERTSNQQQQPATETTSVPPVTEPVDDAIQLDPTGGETDGTVMDPATEAGQTPTNIAGVTTQEGSATAGTTAPASITGLVAQVNEFGGAWANWDHVPGVLSYFWVCWNTADLYGPKFTSSPEHSGNGTQIGALTTAGTYGFRVYAKTASGYVAGETQFSFSGVTGQQAGTQPAPTGSTPPGPADPSEEAIPASVTGIIVESIGSSVFSVTWDPVADAISYVVSRWNLDDPDCCNWTSDPVPTPAPMAVSIPPAGGNYGIRVVATTANGEVAGETRIHTRGAAATGTTEGAAPAAVTGIIFWVNADGGAVGTWDPVPDAISYFAVLWNSTNQNSTPWVTSRQDFNNARMRSESASTGWQIGILPLPGTYVLRVYATTASGAVATGEAQVNFAGASDQQSGTIRTAAPAVDTGVVLHVNGDGGAIGTWDPIPDANSYFAVLWNATDQNTAPWVTSSQDFNNARMLPGSGSTGWQIGILPSPGTYVLRVYATTATGVVATGEAQGNFAGVSSQQAGATGTPPPQDTGTSGAEPPASVTGIMIGTIDNATVSITWDPVPDAMWYVVSRWNLDDPDCCNWTSVPVPAPEPMPVSMPTVAGAYGFRVVATTAKGDVVGETRIQWGGAVNQPAGIIATGPTDSPVQEPAPQPAETVQSGSYKVSIIGLSVTTPTNEDPSFTDGSGDEVFICAALVAWDRSSGSESSFSFVQSVDYGDVADGRYSGRVRAGHASQTGGIRYQDLVPDDFDPDGFPSGTPKPEQLPLVMWQGTLTAGRETIVLSPSVWEHDGARNVLESYINLWQSCAKSDLMNSFTASAGLWGQEVGASEAVFFPEILNGEAATSFVTPPWTGYKLARMAFNAGVDRPIGFEVMPGQLDVLKYGERFVFITQEKLGSLQVGQALTVEVNYAESTESNIGGGNYRLHVRIERTL